MPKKFLRRSRKSSYSRRRRRTYRIRKTGKFAGRRYYRVQRGGKFYRRYPRIKSMSKRIVVNRKHKTPSSRGLDREHFKITGRMSGTLTWLQQSMANWTLDLSDVKQWAVGTFGGGVWTMPSGGSDYAFSDIGSNLISGTEIISNKYKTLYISGAMVTWQVSRTDHNDDSVTTMLMTPLHPTKYADLSLTFAPNVFWPGADLYESFNNQLNETGTKRRVLSTVTSGRQTGTLSYWIPFKKYLSPGFPLSSASWWTDTVSGSTAAAWVKPTSPYFPYLATSLYNDGTGHSGGDLFEMRYKITWYITAFDPHSQTVILDPLRESKDPLLSDPPMVTTDEKDYFTEEDEKHFSSLQVRTPPPPSPSLTSMIMDRKESKEEKKALIPTPLLRTRPIKP